MSFFKDMKSKCDSIAEKTKPAREKTADMGRGFAKTVSFCYRYRAIVLTVVTVILAIIMAVYSGSHLPEQVGINLQSDGTFSTYIARGQAIACCFILTMISLGLMLLSKKTLYPWLISLFTFAVPILILVTNYLAGVI